MFKPILIAISLFLLESIAVLATPIPYLLGNLNADDFYYYLVLAQHTAQGLGATFDGSELTNGFHPLYYLFLTGIAFIPIDNPQFLIRVALILLLLFHHATALVLFWYFCPNMDGQDTRPTWIAWLVVCLWWFNPWTLVITLRGVEAPIATFLWAIIIVNILKQQNKACIITPIPFREIKHAIAIGLLFGLAILARTDTLLLLAIFIVTKTYRLHSKHFIKHAFIILIFAFLITSPWWCWSYVNFGQIMQVSGHAVFLGSHGFDWFKPTFILRETVFNTLFYFSNLLVYTMIPLLVAGFLAWNNRQNTSQLFFATMRKIISDYDFAVLTMIVLAIWYGVWQWHVQSWYLLPTILIVTIAVGLIAKNITEQISYNAFKMSIGIIIVSGVVSTAGFSLVEDFGFGYPHQVNGYYIAQWLNDNTEQTAIIGSWNSGIIGYFTNRSVVNLDGVVNNSLHDYKISHRATSLDELLPYIRKRGITYLTDYEHFYIENPDEMGLKLIYESGMHGFRVYHVK